MLKDFQYRMVSDRTTVLSRYFGILNKESGNAERGTFIISPEGVLKTIEIHTDPVGRSAKELVRKLYGLKFVTENK
jgi:alkyl hydroperoxide reductase, subunit C